ncbi:MAG: enoyl-CoA hydratase/isomerase family protein [Deltaproteobacteria bacterium]|nr:enoyl-CoA hydratase/isomerase family protein [Deltaproteobacteria bacterium]
MYETLDVKVEKRVGWLTLDRPKKMNAMNLTMMMELRKAFDELDEREDVSCVVLRGEGRAFCAGMDLKWSEELTKKDRLESNRLGQKTFSKMEAMSKPVFAAVHGYCLGGALELALGADFIIAAEDAQFGFPEITLSAEPPYRPKIAEDGDPDQPEYGGSAPGWGGVKRMPERVGKALAKELLFTGARIDAARAFQIGLVNAVYPMDKFEEEVRELANRIGAMNSYNLRLVKELVNNGYDLLEGHPS